MTKPYAILTLTLAAAVLTPGGGVLADPARVAQLPLDDFDSAPDPVDRDPGPDLAVDGPEELAAPQTDAASDMDEAEASRLVGYNSIKNPWLPVCEEELPGWQPELTVPLNCLDCECDGKLPGRACSVWRSFQKPTHASIDQECVVCVKEPCLGYEKVHYTVDAVVQKCFESEECFRDKECADGRCIEKEGTKTVRQLYPCKAKVKLCYWKPVVKYRDVYYYIHCQPCHEGDQQVAQR